MAQGHPEYPIGTASVSWVDQSGQVHIRVYSCDGYWVVERCWDGDGWTNGSFNQQGSQSSATCWADSAGEHIRVYCTFQNVTTEWCHDPGTDWVQGGYTTT